MVQEWAGRKEAESKSEPLKGSERGLERMRGKALRRKGATKQGWRAAHRLGGPLSCSRLLKLFRQAPGLRTPRGWVPQGRCGHGLRLRAPWGSQLGQGLFVFPFLLSKTSGAVTAASEEWGTVSGPWPLHPSLVLGLIAS